MCQALCGGLRGDRTTLKELPPLPVKKGISTQPEWAALQKDRALRGCSPGGLLRGGSISMETCSLRALFPWKPVASGSREKKLAQQVMP